ncbi:malonyl-ACP O-methyltransferase BioC [Marinobacter salexigens]|uniref:Malonyl-[acyl-carrier protein] O-methyltransferase n=1 Tax=Marinobacter salexigens TaxID=1925763 RepID=A0ABS6A9S2_9GAMM|nr:malonyl-ACP O-methyltransferase BioC [Marinobacter salexigens]MBU2874844.1 malonyl-ACP O-methyltransferase BioC [Marinobacter salexigens]
MSVLSAVASCPASKADISREFGKARVTYEGASRLQRLMGNTMLERLGRQAPLRGGQILDLGCGTGWFSRELANLEGSECVTGMDLSFGMIEHAGAHSPPDIAWVVADAEAIPLPDQSCDLVFSNLMIQWCATPSQVLRECRRVLRPGGKLMVSTLLDGTLRELDQAWQRADPGQRHINRFESERALRRSASQELPDADIETRTLKLPYDSPLTLASELRQLGAGYKSADRRSTVTSPGRFRAMCQHYPADPEEGVFASYEAAWVYWTSPDANDDTLIDK